MGALFFPVGAARCAALPRHVRLIGAEDGTGRTGLVDVPQLPVRLELTFGALPGPCEIAWVVRVQVPLPLL